MMKAKCIDKARDKNNNIIGYKLQDQQGNTTIVKPKVLKSAIKAKEIEIINLTLTSDNRLIDTTPKPQQASKSKPISNISEEQIKLIIEKAKVLGLRYKITEIQTHCKHKCILISKDENNHILYIPDDVIQLNIKAIGVGILNNHEASSPFTQHIKNLQGHIKVIGGHNLKNVTFMFYHCKAQSLDLSSFDTSKVEDMSYMFYECQARSLDLSNFDTSKVEDMSNMFEDCQAQSLDLSSFDTSSVTYMNSMFYYCEAQSLDLSSFDTSNVTDMHYMFCNCHAQSIDLSSFNTSNVTSMNSMFYYCEAQSLDLSSFDTSNVTDMSEMFSRCKAQSIDLSSFDTSNVTSMSYMFHGCQAQSLDLSNFNTSNVTYMKNMFRKCQAQIKATNSKILEAYKCKSNGENV